jgi:hypothetical protein
MEPPFQSLAGAYVERMSPLRPDTKAVRAGEGHSRVWFPESSCLSGWHFWSSSRTRLVPSADTS